MPIYLFIHLFWQKSGHHEILVHEILTFMVDVCTNQRENLLWLRVSVAMSADKEEEATFLKALMQAVLTISPSTQVILHTSKFCLTMFFKIMLAHAI